MIVLDTQRALAAGGLVEMTTIGRRTGLPRRIDIALHGIDGHLYVSGLPGRRDWYANVLAMPHVVLHVSGEVRDEGEISIDLPADARPVTDVDERRNVMEPIARGWGRDVEPMVRRSPLVELTPVEVPMRRMALAAGAGRDRSALVEV